MLNRSQQALFILLNAGIRNKNPEKNFFSDFSDSEWKEVYHHAIEQGVMAIVFDAVMRLPEELKPPRSLKLNWAFNVEALEKRYSRQEGVARELAEIFEANNIRVFFFKGISLARLYPVPSHREFGDLDIYLFGEYKKGNQLLLQYGQAEKNINPKHLSSSYKGIVVENHIAFLSPDTNSYLKNIENTLIKLSKEALKEPYSNILFPTSNYNILLIMSHAIIHFPYSIVLRHLCDWVVFLEANKGKVDFVNYNKLLSEAGLLTVADAFTALAVRFLELKQESAPKYSNNPALEDKILLNILNPLRLHKIKPSPLDIIVFKYRTFKSRRWKHKLISNDEYYKIVLNSIYYHIRHPQSIFKTK